MNAAAPAKKAAPAKAPATPPKPRAKQERIDYAAVLEGLGDIEESAAAKPFARAVVIDENSPLVKAMRRSYTEKKAFDIQAKPDSDGDNPYKGTEAMLRQTAGQLGYGLRFKAHSREAGKVTFQAVDRTTRARKAKGA